MPLKELEYPTDLLEFAKYVVWFMKPEVVIQLPKKKFFSEMTEEELEKTKNWF